MEKEPLYLKIYHALHSNIMDGVYAAGDKLPSEKEISDRFQVSRITSKKALELLVEDKLITRMPGKGSFVLGKSPDESGMKEKERQPEHLLIGLIMSDYSESYGLKIIYGIEEAVAAKGCSVVTKRSFGNQKLEDESIDILIELGVKGLIIMPVHGEHYNPKILRLVLDGFPVVFIDRNLKGIQASFVGTDNVNAAKKATDYLLKLGHRHISFLSPPPKDTSTIEERIDGFVKSHAEFGTGIDESLWLNNLVCSMPSIDLHHNIDSDIEKIQRKLRENPQITCFFIDEYNLALVAMEAVKSIGLSVPEDISILCFDGPVNMIGEQFFTHVRQREREMGMIAVDLLLKQIEGGNRYRKVYLDADLVVGKSTRKL